MGTAVLRYSTHSRQTYIQVSSPYSPSTGSGMRCESLTETQVPNVSRIILLTRTALRIRRQTVLSEGRVLSLSCGLHRRHENMEQKHVSLHTDFTEHCKGTVLQSRGFKVRTTRVYRKKKSSAFAKYKKKMCAGMNRQF